MARRTAISRSRVVPRASSRLATFAQTISSRMPTAMASTRSAGRLGATICSLTASDVEAPHTRRQRLRERARRRLGTQPVADGIGFVGRGLDRHAVPQARDRRRRRAFGVPASLRQSASRNRRAGREVEARIHDADDGERRAVEKSGFRSERLQRDRAPDDAGVGLEVPAPRAGADDDDVGAGRFVAPVERAAEPARGRRAWRRYWTTPAHRSRRAEPRGVGISVIGGVTLYAMADSVVVRARQSLNSVHVMPVRRPAECSGIARRHRSTMRTSRSVSVYGSGRAARC